MSLLLLKGKGVLVQRRFPRAFSVSYLFLRSLRCWTSSLTFQEDAIYMNPYFSQIRSSRKRQSEGMIKPALSYSVCGI